MKANTIVQLLSFTAFLSLSGSGALAGEATPNTAPHITCPADAAVDCPSVTGAPIVIRVMVSDPDADLLTVSLRIFGGLLEMQTVNGPVANGRVTFAPVTFLPGMYRLTVTVDDGMEVASCETGVAIEADTTPPVIVCPDDIFVDKADPAGAIVNYPAVMAVDMCGATVHCAPEAGTRFPIGDTRVNCVAVDVAGNQASCAFQVHVSRSTVPISGLQRLVKSLGLDHGIETSYLVKLNAAQAALAAQDTVVACQSLQAFINHAKAQRGKKLTVAQANRLIAEAIGLQDMIGCP